MSDLFHLSHIRREYGDLNLDESTIKESPFEQFQLWINDALATETDPNVMILSTVDQSGFPDSRAVLLKELTNNVFIFFTNYHSHKAQQIERNPQAALLFYWSKMTRQVRIRGHVTRTSAAVSDQYFASRPLTSQVSAIVSPQSEVISNRETLEQACQAMLQAQQAFPRPTSWGGYQLNPIEFEFFQGRDNRLHDRIHYYRQDGHWQHHRLAP